MGTVEPLRVPPLVNFAHFPKVNVLVEADSNWEAPTQAALVSEQCCLEKLGKLEAANAALLF
jgi:hypothetical protein